jgi:hypothetical protein
MAPPALRPRSPGEIVDAAFQILRGHYAQFVTCSAIAYTPVLLLRLFVIGDPTRLLEGDLEAAAGNAASMMGLGMLGGWITFSLMSAVLLICASQAYLGEPVDAGAAVRQALPRVPQVLVAAVLRFVAMVLGFLAMIFPVLWVAALLFAVTPVIVLERGGVWAAFRRSASLSKGRKGHILNTLGLVAIIYWVLVVGFSTVAAIFGSFVVATVMNALVTVLVYPVVAITEAVLYYDARIQSEGLDIELMTEALDPSPPSGMAAT